MTNITNADRLNVVALKDGSANSVDQNNAAAVIASIDKILAGDVLEIQNFKTIINALPESMLKTLCSRMTQE